MRVRTSFVGSSPNQADSFGSQFRAAQPSLACCAWLLEQPELEEASCVMRIEAGGPARPCGRGASSGSLDIPTPNGALLAAPTCPRPRLPRRATIFPLNALSQRPALSRWILSRHKTQLSNHNRFIDHRTRSRFLLISSPRPTVRSCSAGSSSRRASRLVPSQNF